MIDLRAVRAHPAAARASQRARGEDDALVDALLAAAGPWPAPPTPCVLSGGCSAG